MTNGVLVQLVRIHACHAWGHGFESRTHRKKPLMREPRGFFVVYTYRFSQNLLYFCASFYNK